ncbi:MAG: PKD domain-containing protein [Chitinophagaceae bacterium]
MIHKTNFFRHSKMWRVSYLTTVFIWLCSYYSNAQVVSPQFLLSSQVQCFQGNNFEVVNITQGDNITYRWDFGDGTFDTSRRFVKKYSQIGHFDITLIATRNNVSYYFSKTVIVAPEPVISSIQLQGTLNGSSYTFISSSTIAFGTMAYFWDFGDSVSSTLINPVHTYDNPGNYNVSLEVQSNYGCKSTNNHIANVLLYDTASIRAKFTINKANQCLTGNSFIFSNNSNLSQVSNFFWDFGDGTSSNDVSPTKVYSSNGKYTVRLTIVNAGVISICEKIVTVAADFIVDFDTVSVHNNANYTFINKVVPLATTLNYFWDFGDGCSSQVVNPTHLYSAGSYNVHLKVKDTLGCEVSVVKTITINPVNQYSLSSLFTINSDSQCLKNNLFVFNNLSTKQCNVSYYWSFGDGTFSSVESPTKQYSKAGIYNVILKVISGNNFSIYTKRLVINNTAIWTGAFSNNWLDSANWLCSFPSDSFDLVIMKSPQNPLQLRNVTFRINNLTIENGASCTFDNSSINVYGLLSNNGVLNAITSSLEFSGNKSQILNGNMKVGKLTINNFSGVSIGSSILDSVSVYNVLTLKNGIFNTNEKLVLKSTSTRTARLDKVGVQGNTGSLIGNVIIERFFFNKRGWRFYTTPITAGSNNANFSINQTWQKYTNITGPSGVGLDYITPFHSLKGWNNNTQTWELVSNTYTSYIANTNNNFSNIPYCIFFRGDKSVTDLYSSKEATFKILGKLQSGNQVMNFSGNKKGNFLLIANPYASPVDIGLIQSQGISGNFYFYDPTLNESGAYVTVSNKGNGNWVVTPTNAAQKDRILQSCNALFVEVSQPSGFVMFTENSKVDETTNNVFGVNSKKLDKLYVNLYRVNADSSKTLLDGAVTIFGDSYTKSVDENDSKKMMNVKENIGFVCDNEILAIEARPYVSGQDSINIFTSGLADSINYAIEFKLLADDSTIQNVTLFDSIVGSRNTATNGTTTWYHFKSLNNIAGKKFSLYVTSAQSQFKLTNLGGSQIDKNVKIFWKSENEQFIKEYQLQRLSENQDFTTISVVKPTNTSNNYHFIDEDDKKQGQIVYRIVAVFKNDVKIISQNIAVDYKKIVVNEMSVYPNPASKSFTINFYTENKQTVSIKIVEIATGKTIKKLFVNTQQGNNKVPIEIENKLNIVGGLYAIHIDSDEIIYKPFTIVLAKAKD